MKIWKSLALNTRNAEAALCGWRWSMPEARGGAKRGWALVVTKNRSYRAIKINFHLIDHWNRSDRLQVNFTRSFEKLNFRMIIVQFYNFFKNTCKLLHIKLGDFRITFIKNHIFIKMKELVFCFNSINTNTIPWKNDTVTLRRLKYRNLSFFYSWFYVNLPELISPTIKQPATLTTINI